MVEQLPTLFLFALSLQLLEKCGKDMEGEGVGVVGLLRKWLLGSCYVRRLRGAWSFCGRRCCLHVSHQQSYESEKSWSVFVRWWRESTRRVWRAGDATCHAAIVTAFRFRPTWVASTCRASQIIGRIAGELGCCLPDATTATIYLRVHQLTRHVRLSGPAEERP